MYKIVSHLINISRPKIFRSVLVVVALLPTNKVQPNQYHVILLKNDLEVEINACLNALIYKQLFPSMVKE